MRPLLPVSVDLASFVPSGVVTPPSNLGHDFRRHHCWHGFLYPPAPFEATQSREGLTLALLQLVEAPEAFDLSLQPFAGYRAISCSYFAKNACSGILRERTQTVPVGHFSPTVTTDLRD